MNSIKSVIFALLVSIFVAGCATTLTRDIEVDAQADPRINMAGYKTYAWLGSAEIVHDPDGQWEPPQFDADAEIRFLINREMRKFGMREVMGNPDLVVAFAAGIDMAALELKEDAKKEMTILENTPKGALVVLFLDAGTGRPIWAGAATGEVQQRKFSSEEVKKRLDYAVTQMFRKLPGKASGAEYY